MLELVGRALLNKEIAHRAGMTEGSVKQYLYQISKKVGARNRVELALYAHGVFLKREKQGQ